MNIEKAIRKLIPGCFALARVPSLRAYREWLGRMFGLGWTTAADLEIRRAHGLPDSFPAWVWVLRVPDAMSAPGSRLEVYFLTESEVR